MVIKVSVIPVSTFYKDMDELTKKARNLLSEVALPCFVCTHDHPKYLAMEQYYYSKGRTIIDESVANLMRVKSVLQQCKEQVEQERTRVSSAEIKLAQVTLLAKHRYYWNIEVGSKKDVGAAKSTLRRCEKDFRKAQSSLKEIEQKKLPAELVQTCLMHTLPKHLTMDRYYYSKE